MCAKKVEATQKDCDYWKGCFEILMGKEEEMIKQQEETKEWFEDTVNNFIEKRCGSDFGKYERLGSNAQNWAIGWRKDLEERGFTVEKFVAAVEKRWEELKRKRSLRHG